MNGFSKYSFSLIHSCCWTAFIEQLIVTIWPRSPDVILPTCFWPHLARILRGTCTDEIPLSSRFHMFFFSYPTAVLVLSGFRMASSGWRRMKHLSHFRPAWPFPASKGCSMPFLIASWYASTRTLSCDNTKKNVPECRGCDIPAVPQTSKTVSASIGRSARFPVSLPWSSGVALASFDWCQMLTICFSMMPRHPGHLKMLAGRNDNVRRISYSPALGLPSVTRTPYMYYTGIDPGYNY